MITRPWLRRALLLAGLLASAGAGAQQPPVTRSAEGIVVDLQDVDIRIAITALAEAAGLNVTFNELPARRVTLRLRQPVPPDSVRGLLKSIAASQGIQVIEQGMLMRFEAPRPAEPDATATRGAQQPRLYVYRLKHANALRLAGTLQGIFGGSLPESSGPERVPLSERLRGQRILRAFDN